VSLDVKNQTVFVYTDIYVFNVDNTITYVHIKMYVSHYTQNEHRHNYTHTDINIYINIIYICVCIWMWKTKT